MNDNSFNFDRSLGFLLSDCHRMLGTAMDRHIRRAGIELSRSQWRVIGHLARNDGLTQTELAELLEMERAPLGTLVDKLENAGWVERRADPRDRRAKRVFITEAGHEVLPLIREQTQQTMNDMMAGLSPEQVDNLIDSLQTIKQNLLNQRDTDKAA